MEKVFLRVYDREIESMIEGGQLDEAVAHCQHILKTFPMHVETYRLLGKAFLEARRYADAADIFQRVLMAVPDDFVSNVGMSIIRDDEGKLDDAIWHMERAFEVQPSNSAIQSELRRLFGRRDGVEPSKIRLSRDALANMYSQGELFNQAIAEIRSVLADDPNRPDLQVMLMRAYFRSGQKVEAAEIAATLLKKYPYCLDSLRVLVDVLPGTARAENMQVYSHRLSMLDPYSSFTKDSVFSSDQVVDSAVNLERLDYRPGVMPGSPQPDWASSLGIKLNADKRSEPAPEWMQTSESAEKPAATLTESNGPEAAPAAGAAADAIPDWMRSAGWQDSSAEPKVTSANNGDVLPDQSIAKADIPDWLMSMAPAEAIEAANTEPEEPIVPLPAGEDGIPEWLKPMAPTEATGEAQAESQASVVSGFESGGEPIVPAEAAGEKSIEAQGYVEPQPASREDIPDWFKSTVPAQAASDQSLETLKPVEPQPEGSEDVPEWLKSMTPAESAGETIKQPQQPVEPQFSSAGDVPEWLKSVAPAEAAGETFVESQEPVELQPVSAEDIPDWLKSVAPSEATGETNVESQKPAEPQPESGEYIPDWLKSMTPAEPAGEIPVEPQGTSESQPASGVANPDWLNTMAPVGAAGMAISEPQEPVEPQTPSDENIPDWLKSITPAGMTDESSIVSESGQPEEPTMRSEPEPTSIESSSLETEALRDWRTDLGANAAAPSTPNVDAIGQPETGGQNVPEQPVPVEPASQTPVIPSTSEPPTGGEPFQPSGEVKPLNIGDDALGWLESLAAKQGAKPEELLTNPQDRSMDMPDWLRQPAEKPIESPAEPAQEPVINPPESPHLEPLEQITSPSMPTPGQSIEEAFSPQEEGVPSEIPTETVIQPPIQPTSGEEDTLSWLEKMSNDHETTNEEPWVSPQENLEQPVPDQQIMEGQSAVNAPEEPTPVSPEPVSSEGITITSWLSRLDVEEAMGKTSSEQTGENKPDAPLEDLPDWLKDLENPVEPVETPKVGDDLPEWLRHPIPPSQPESTSAPEVPAWVDENAPVTGQAVPTMPEEWVPAEPKPEPRLEPEIVPESSIPVVEPPPVSVPVSPPETKQVTESGPSAVPEPVSAPVSFSVQTLMRSPTLKQTGMLSVVPIQDKDAELLSNAQTVLAQDSLDESMKLYTKLIKKGRLLDEVIHDLREAIYRFPVDVIIWQTLGDAYMRANRLQDALDAYTKAEELLR